MPNEQTDFFDKLDKPKEPVSPVVEEKINCQYCEDSGICQYCERGRIETERQRKAGEGLFKKKK